MVSYKEKNTRKKIICLIISFSYLLLLLSKEAYCFLSPKEEKLYWEKFKNIFITNDYVNDTYYKNATHSEAQGIGLLLAVYFNDKKTFTKIWDWTEKNLQARNDYLFAWLWGKDTNGNWCVLDYNNASDADIMIAWSLILASEKWKDKVFLSEAKKIIQDIKRKLIITHKNKLILLPGQNGFIKADKIIINPSYYIFPAILKFNQITPDKVWSKIISDIHKIINEKQKGYFQLIPDWIIIKIKNCVITKKEKYWGYESIRLYLYETCINKNIKILDNLNNYIKLFSKFSWIPDKVDLTKNMISLNDSPAGFYAVYATVAKNKKLKEKLISRAKEKIIYDQSYYSFSLFLLSNFIDKYCTCKTNKESMDRIP